MMKRTQRRIAFSVIAVILIVAAVLLFLKFWKKPASSGNAATPTPVATVAPTESAENKNPTEVPEGTKAPDATETPDATKIPEATEEPSATKAPEATEAPTVTATPVPTLDPSVEIPVGGDDEPTAMPTATTAPEVGKVEPTKAPEATSFPIGPTPVPAPTFAPTNTPTPAPTSTPKPTATPTPKATAKPTATVKPTVKPTIAPTQEASLDYFITELARVCGISGADVKQELISKGILPVTVDTENVLRKDAFAMLQNAARYMGQKNDTNMVTLAQSFSRLSDVSGLSDGDRLAAYYCYGNGLVEGVSDGDFTRTRSMKPNAKLSKSDADLYLARLSGKSAKRVLSPDAQVTRTSNLKNMDLYPYILDNIPDSFYTRAFKFMTIKDSATMKPLYESGKKDSDGTIWVDGGGNYASPVKFREMYGPNGTQITKYHVLDSVYSMSAMEKAVEEYLYKTFNVDYRTTPTDTAWRTYMRDMLRDQAMGSGVDKAHDAMVDNYLRLMKENRTVIECDFVRAEASTMFDSIDGNYIRCYVHYRVVSFDSTKKVMVSVDGLKGYINPLLFTLSTEKTTLVDLCNLKAGEWRDGYFDIMLGYSALQGIEPMKVQRGVFDDRYNDYSITDY